MSDEIYFRVRSGLHVDLRTLDKATAKLLRGLFDYPNPDFGKRERMGLWTGSTPRRVQSYEERGHELILPRGGTDAIREALAARGQTAWFEDERLEKPPMDFVMGERASPIELRPHQERIVAACLERENCLVRSSTGSGKTEAALDFIRKARQPALVVVWTSGLLSQWVDRIKLRWGWGEGAIGVWGGGKKRLGNGIMVGMQQTLVKDAPRLAQDYGTLVCDEVQKFAAKTFREVVSGFPARYRIGFSDDERRKDRMDFLIRDHFGRVAEEVEAKELIDAGHLCEVEVLVVPTGLRIKEIEECPPEARTNLLVELQAEIQATIASDPERNRIAHAIAGTEARAGRSVLVFCNRLEQARELARQIAIAENVPCGLMLGGPSNREAYQDAKARLSSGAIRCAVGSSAIYQGEDIPRLSVGVVVTPTGGNKQLLRQQSGRLRRKFPGKLRGRLFYLWDEALFPTHLENLQRWFGRDMVRLWEPGS